MEKLMKIEKLVGLILLICLPVPAMAYIDPGSGSAIMSAIIGFIVATWLVVKTYWYKIKSFFKLTRDGDSREDTDQTPKEERNE